eukprot:3136337-Lingulodinium_polyedra.AAC.1
MFRGRSGSQIARKRSPCVGRFSPHAWSAFACDLRGVAAAKRRFNRVIAQGVEKRCAMTRSNRCFARLARC